MSVFRSTLPLLASCLLVCGVHAAAAGPNILFILADDLGYTDVNAFAARLTGERPERMFYETPNIDRLVSEGTAFSQAYACPLCSPTRASLLTGINAARLGFTTATPHTAQSYHARGVNPPVGYLPHDVIHWGDDLPAPQPLLNASSLLALPAGRADDAGRDALTIAEALSGYRSAFIGKWHLGGHGAAGHQPRDHGFEEVCYFDAGGSPFFQWAGLWNRKQKHHPSMPQDELLWGSSGEPTGKTYLTDDLTERACRFIRSHHERSSGRPFLLHLCHFAVHTPLQAKPEDVARFETKPAKGWNGHSNPVYAAMIRGLDESVGRLMATLEELGIARDTLVIFMSDNGGVSWVTRSPDAPITSNSPLKGGKAMLFEGGIRVPLVFRWPDRIAAGRWADTPVHCSDLFPTLIDASGGNAEALRKKTGFDGQSLMPLLEQGSAAAFPESRTMIWHYPFNAAPLHPDDGLPVTPQSAIRKGDMKLIFDWSGRLYLHDIAADPFERDNLAVKLPGFARRLFLELNDWLDANVEPKYMPALNPEYDSAARNRTRPFTDLRRHFLGPDRAIRTASSDPRLASQGGGSTGQPGRSPTDHEKKP